MYPILRHLDSITARPDGSYDLPSEARMFFEAYLTPYGFSLARITTHQELVDTISWCNSQEFARTVSKYSPTAGLHFIWARLRKLTQAR